MSRCIMVSKDTQKLLNDLFEQARNKPKRIEQCRATYKHYAHDDCPGVGPTREEHDANPPDYDNVSYLEFYHETYIFDDEVFRIEVGEGGIAEIRADTNIITHENGRTQEIPWACVRAWSHVK